MNDAEKSAVLRNNKKPRYLRDILDRNRGIGPGFDLLRIGLATMIFLAHAGFIFGQGAQDAGLMIAANMETVTGNLYHNLVDHEWVSWRQPIYRILVPMFFAVSGFLVCGSAIRLRKVRPFLAFRLLRILPALLVEVSLSALVLGALFTTLPLKDYYSDPVFFGYFLNIIGEIHMQLPGVFLDNPVSGIINNSLWTLPIEFYCYLFMALLMATGLLYKRSYLMVVFVPLTIFAVLANIYYGWASDIGNFNVFTIVYYFFLGIVFHHYADRIPFHPGLAIASVAIGYLCIYFKAASLIAPFFVTYATIYLGMMPLPKLPLLKSGDYSYGIYLYGFPISQALYAGVPGLHDGNRWLFIASAYVITLLLAIASWHLVEKHFLKLKKYVADKTTVERPA